MATLFSQVLNMSLTGSIVIVLVIFVRWCLRKYPKIFSYVLWAAVLFRLLCPVAFTAPVSVLSAFEPEAKEVSQTASVVSYLPENPGLSVDFNAPVTEIIVTEPNQEQQQPDTPVMTPMHWAAIVWLAGGAVLILYSFAQYVQLRTKLIGSAQYRKGIYLADHLETAFVLGIFVPKIYIRSSVPVQERRYIIAHERHHIRRGDHIIKLLAFLALCIHWFNPLAWVAFVLAGRDMEMSCDEAVIRQYGPEIRGDYATALLKLTVNRQIVPGMPLAFGEGDTKGRVKNMAKWKQPKIWVSILCLLLCIVILIACAVNPEKEQSLEDMTRVHGPASIGVDELEFNLPEGFSIEVQELDGHRDLDPDKYRHIIRKNGQIAGGVNVLSYPSDDTPITGAWDWVEALNIPENVPQERFLLSVQGDVFTPQEVKMSSYTACVSYGKNGVEETCHYLFEGEEYIYDLWFDMQIVTETEKTAVLNSAVQDASKMVPYDLSSPFRFLPDGFRYRCEQPHKGLVLDGNQQTIGGISVHTIPDGFSVQEYTSREFLAKLGISAADDQALGYYMDGSGNSWTAEFFSNVPPTEVKTHHSWHQFYATEDGYVIEIWFDSLLIEDSGRNQILNYIDIPAINRIRNRGVQVKPIYPAPALHSFEIREFPDGYRYEVLGDDCVLFIHSNDVVGGVDVFTIPEEIYDPHDTTWFWLEEMGLADFEDATLCYMGGMTSGDNGWLAEFASDVPEGTPVTVHRRHVYRVVGDKLYDIWLDMNFLNYDEANELSCCVRFFGTEDTTQNSSEETPEEIAFNVSTKVMDAVSDGSAYILSRQEKSGNEGPRGYERKYLYHEGNYLYTNQMLPEGENITEAGAYFNRFALMIVEDQFFTNDGHQGETGEIQWSLSQPTDAPAPWLGNRVWVKSYVTYIDTMTDDDGVCYMFRYDKPYEEDPDYDGHYFVNFNFDKNGNFKNVQLQVNLFRENEFTITESILSMDPNHISNMIQAEYNRAVN